MAKIKEKKPKYIEVNIKCYQIVEYNQNKKMKIEDYEALLELHEEDVSQYDNPKQYHLINDYLDPRDIMDAGQEFTRFEIEKVK